jgi:hypothetical protein
LIAWGVIGIKVMGRDLSCHSCRSEARPEPYRISPEAGTSVIFDFRTDIKNAIPQSFLIFPTPDAMLFLTL